jgi:type II restriction endonuclease
MSYVEESTLKVLRMPIYNEFGYITIDDARIDETCNAYFKWKDLNTYISNNSRRGINMPDAITEKEVSSNVKKRWVVLVSF